MVVSVLSCIVMAVIRSNALVEITVNTIDGDSEPLDCKLPLVKQLDSQPDYELALINDSGAKRYQGAESNQSAVVGIRWTLGDPVAYRRLLP
jgi:hypothetical protein